MKLLAVLLLLSVSAFAQQSNPHPRNKENSSAHARDKEIKDPDTRSWWHYTEALSGDAMEGRDVGSAGYERAANIVADHFKADGLKPAGDNGTYFQEMPMFESQVLSDGTSFVLLRQGFGAGGGKGEIQQPYKFLHQITIRASEDLPKQFEGELVFAGYCAPKQTGVALPDVRDKIVLCFGTHDRKLVEPAQRAQALRDGGAKAVIIVDDPSFVVEPPRWPIPYARTVTTTDPKAPRRGADRGPSIPSMTLNSSAFKEFIDASGKEGNAILAKAGRGEPLESFDVRAKLRVTLNAKTRNYTSKNVLAILLGSDPKLPGDASLKSEYVVLSAHLDGYGYGEPVNGDKLYNGTLDDAAYVALLMQEADRLALRPGAPKQRALQPKRSILFCVFTGEEKGLLGSRWYTQHLTVPKEKLVAVINLDQLRPLFPLNILTTLALDQSTLGQSVKDVAAAPINGQTPIQVRPDLEPERNLLMRTDHWPFMEIGVPAVSFVFGYDKGTDAEKKYREWYQTRYHRPQDDLTQPVDFDAATKFNQFFYRLVAKVANDEKRPEWIK